MHWENATWGCPWKLYQDNLFAEEEKNNKILVCGHWHSYDFREHLDITSSNLEDINFDIYSNKNNSIIALDACTAISKKCNVMIIDDNYTAFDQYGNRIK